MVKNKQNLSLDELLEEALVPEHEWPYKVPKNWVWTRIDNVAIYKKGPFGSSITKAMFVPKGKDTYKIYEQGNAIRKDKNYGNYYITKEKYNELKGFKVDSGDLIVSCAGTIGETYLLPDEIEPGIINQALMKINVNKNISLQYYLLYFDQILREDITGSSKGTAIKNIPPLSVLKNIPFPLPSLAEQQRIVNRIESLFEKLEQAKELIQDALDSFENRKAAILHKAFCGELTSKWREENKVDSAETIIRCVVSNRKELMNLSKEVKQCIEDYDFKEVTNENGWVSLKAMVFCDNITCGGTPTGFITESGEIPFLKVYNIVKNTIDFESKPQFVDSETHNTKLKSSILKADDVVMNIVGPPLRKIAIIPDTYNEWNMNQAIVRFRTVDYVNPRYLYYALLNPSTLEPIIQETKGVVGQANISITQSRNLTIPIASRQEQNEIVKILDDVLCSDDKASMLVNQLEMIEAMKKSILARAFRGELGTNDPEEESAMELLKSILLDASKKIDIKKERSKPVSVPDDIASNLTSVLEKEIYKMLLKKGTVVISELLDISSKKLEVIDAIKSLEDKGLINKNGKYYSVR